ncbi:hypothetical protein [Thalassobacillus sp. C254]|uniref:hypothetical protein n=1 Tax=Thalassobacillus sp. C254 TaxID=1225341 RepID=UPI0018DD3CEC|nr:hypothetical protein [Thalassobacillus sp. C254]
MQKGDRVIVSKPVDQMPDTIGYYDQYKNQNGLVVRIKETKNKDSLYFYNAVVLMDKTKKEIKFESN